MKKKLANLPVKLAAVLAAACFLAIQPVWAAAAPPLEADVTEASPEIPDEGTAQEPEEPFEPADDPDSPAEPDQPDDPDSPIDPDNPDDPDNPIDPDNPDDPDSPIDPDNPDGPDEPDQPDEPYVPITPGLDMVNHRVYLQGSEDLFRPEGKTTRAEAAKMIYSLLESDSEPTGESSFSDVSPTAWYTPMVLVLADMGALKGYNDGTFAPGGTITRGEFVVILSRFFEPLEDAPEAFSDVTDAWLKQAVNAAAARGWVEGYGNGTFRPNGKITRAEAVTILNRVLGREGSKAKQKLDADGKVMLFLDLPFNHWAYYDIMEASLAHSHGANGGWASYTVPAAAHKPGYHYIDDELYHVDDKGHWTRNKTVGVQKFDNNGKYTTGNAELDRKLTEIVRANTVEGASARNNFQRLHLYVTRKYTYRAGSYIADGGTGWETNLALEMIRNGKGNCYRFAALDTMLARKLGFQATGISGEIDTGNGFVPHGWVQINENGKILLCDPEIQYVRPNWDLFMKSYSSVYPRYRVQGIRK